MPARFAVATALASALLAGCTGPGMRLDARAPTDAPQQLRARAELLPIDMPTLARLKASAPAATMAARPDVFRDINDPWVYRVGPQDVLRITVFEHPELTNPSGTANELSGRVVNSDGKFFFPYVGAVRAAGRTVVEIRDTIAQGLLRILKNPQVDVSVLQYRSQRIVVSGEVRNPGAVPVTDDAADAGQVIAQAGGLGTEADLTGVTVSRGGTTARADLYAYLYGGEAAQNMRLAHGDVVNVPDRRYNKVFVLGEVLAPNSLVMPRGRMSLAEALADVGGVNPFSANAGQIYVIRDGGERAQIYHLNGSSPESLVLADRFDLRPRDIVFVDSVKVVRWARVVNNILPAADFLRETLNDTTRGLPR